MFQGEGRCGLIGTPRCLDATWASTLQPGGLALVQERLHALLALAAGPDLGNALHRARNQPGLHPPPPPLPPLLARISAMPCTVAAIRRASIARPATSRSSFLHARAAPGPALVRAWSSASTLASSAWALTTSCTRPMRRASAAPKRSAVRK